MDTAAVILQHNLDPAHFIWLWAKYVRGVNPEKHCQASLRGWYSAVLSGKKNPGLGRTPRIMLDERSRDDFRAIYICGVAREGYYRRPPTNYRHNLHAVVLPAEGARDVLVFENWTLEVTNGTFDRIPGLDDLAGQYASRPAEYTACRIYRWAVCNQQLFT